MLVANEYAYVLFFVTFSNNLLLWEGRQPKQ